MKKKEKSYKWLWIFLGILIPIAGFIMLLAWKKTDPKASKWAGIGAGIGFIIQFIIAFQFLSFILGGISSIYDEDKSLVQSIIKNVK